MNAAERASTLVEWWATVYTHRLPAKVARRRRAEISSDLWEHRASGRHAGASAVWTALSMTWRMVSGMPSDLIWRHQQLGKARGRWPEPRRGVLGQRPWWVNVAVVLATFQIVTAASVLYPVNWYPAAIGHIAITTGGGALVVAGIAHRSRSRAGGDVMIAVGALSALSLFWMILPLAGLPVAVAAVVGALEERSPLVSALAALVVVLLALLVAGAALLRPDIGPLLSGPMVAGALAYLVVRRSRYAPGAWKPPSRSV